MDNTIRERAIGRHAMLRKNIYEVGIKAQSFVEEIQNEVNAFAVSETDFASMDFKKIKTLSEELINLQKEYSNKVKEMLNLQKNFNIEAE
jgi:hypothetical protein